jgi:hypothetical protein
MSQARDGSNSHSAHNWVSGAGARRCTVSGIALDISSASLKYPGIPRAALAAVPTNLETLRVSEGMLAILLSGGAEPQAAAWAMDVISLYVAAYALETSLVKQRQKDPDATWVLSQDELVRRFSALPEATFPQTRRYATQLTSGSGHERFDFALGMLIDNLAQQATLRPAAN